MSVRTTWIPEPDLFFGSNRKTTHPQIGLLNFGPHGGTNQQGEPLTISAGAIGTRDSLAEMNRFFRHLQVRIEAKHRAEHLFPGVDFPGLGRNGPLRFDIQIPDQAVSEISTAWVRNLESMKSRKNRLEQLAEEYVSGLDDLSQRDPRPNLILMPQDERIFKACKRRTLRGDRIATISRTFGEAVGKDVPFYDFHDFIKAEASYRLFRTQLMTPATMRFSSRRQSPAQIAWNLSVALYYKGTGIPWKLSDLDDKTCHIGIAFFPDFRKDPQGSMRSALAQVYMQRGESQVVRGSAFEWDESKNGRNIYLPEGAMKGLIEQGVGLYKDQRKEIPRRIVVHKRTPFTPGEIEGIKQGAPNVDSMNALQIRTNPGFRVYTQNEYPVLRGTSIMNKSEGLLFTTGFVPLLRTYEGATIPRPIQIIGAYHDEQLETLSHDMLGLTKLNWNNTDFANHEPVTIDVSRRVGNVMREWRHEDKTLPPQYNYYM